MTTIHELRRLAISRDMLIHIRKPLKKAGRPGYKNRANVDRYNGTQCGSQPTAYDLAPKDKVQDYSGYEVCKACIKKRGA